MAGSTSGHKSAARGCATPGRCAARGDRPERPHPGVLSECLRCCGPRGARVGLRAADVKLVVALVSQGELIWLLNLGPRLSDQEYSGDDRKLLETWQRRVLRQFASRSSDASRKRKCVPVSVSSRSCRSPG